MGKTLFIVGFIGALSVDMDKNPVIALFFCAVLLVGLHLPQGPGSE